MKLSSFIDYLRELPNQNAQVEILSYDPASPTPVTLQHVNPINIELYIDYDSSDKDVLRIGYFECI